jgi:hypothetical protein
MFIIAAIRLGNCISPFGDAFCYCSGFTNATSLHKQNPLSRVEESMSPPLRTSFV